jgi:hypothetical protein
VSGTKLRAGRDKITVETLVKQGNAPGAAIFLRVCPDMA